MKLSDYVAKVIKRLGIKCVFGLQGGAVVHLFDSIEKLGIDVVYTHHEQAASLAAVSYSKSTQNLGCVIVTSGPGSTNAITGLLGAWQDSIPCIFISGQARSDQLSYGKKVRQIGTQEVNIVDIVKPITKFAKCVLKKDEIHSVFKNAIKIAHEGRPGPVWIDIPVDLQWLDINFNPNEVKFLSKNTLSKKSKLQFFKSVEFIKNSKKPLFVIGYGVTLAKQATRIQKIIEKNLIPFVSTWTASDIFATNNKLNLGIIGMSGQKGANKAIFDADLLVCLGTHLSTPQTTTLYDSYALKAKKIIVNIDSDQLKNLNIDFDLKIKADLKDFLVFIDRYTLTRNLEWKNLNLYKEMNWIAPPKSRYINSYEFIRMLSKKVKRKCCYIIDGGGTALYAGFQSSILKKNDRIICSSAISAMGTGLAETIGVFKSHNFKFHICIIGDGSFIMNIQDLQTIVQEQINVKIIVINNNGYQAIRNTQNEFLDHRLYGTHPDWGLKMPSIESISNGFNVDYIKLIKNQNLNSSIDMITNHSGPLVVEVVIDENQKPLFRQKFIKNNNGTFSPTDLSDMLSHE